MKETPKKQVILCVDDDRKNLELLEALLTPRGYDLRLAGTGEEALKNVAAEPPDLILLDIMMPGMSGLTVLEKLRADEGTRLIPVVLLTSLSATEDRIRGIEAGCDDFISKPFDKNELLTRVKALLRGSFYRRALDEREKFEAVIQEMGDGVIVCRPDGTITSINHSAKEYLGLAEGANFVDRIFEKYTVSIEREGVTDLSVKRKNFDIQRKETEAFKSLYLEARMDVLRAPSGEISSVVVVLRDVTSERTEEFMAQDFLALIAHKFNTPVTVVREALDLVKNDVPEGPNQEVLKAAETKIRDIHNLSQRLIFILEAQSKGLRGNLSVSLIENKLFAAIEKLNKSCKIEAAVEKHISAPRVALWKAIVLEELLENAYRFRGKDPLRLRITVCDDFMEVADNGAGIPAEERKKIFEPFYQIYKYFHGNIPGLGLGLTLVKKLVELNKGKIEVESEIGKGTTFKVVF